MLKNVILDLGGVLLNIDYNKTSHAFKELGIENFDEMFSQFKSDELFEKLETGKISEDGFYHILKNKMPPSVQEADIRNAWNAMLLDFRIESLLPLEKMMDTYNLFLLSNTNAIHLAAFKEIFTADTGKSSLDAYFKKAYYSHLIGLRKPTKEVYDFVLKDSGLIAEESLFVDDSINNIEAASAVGIRTHLLLPHETIGDIGL